MDIKLSMIVARAVRQRVCTVLAKQYKTIDDAEDAYGLGGESYISEGQTINGKISQ